MARYYSKRNKKLNWHDRYSMPFSIKSMQSIGAKLISSPVTINNLGSDVVDRITKANEFNKSQIFKGE